MPDMEFKCIGWAGNLYQKFEAMCMEVEEVMHQDTAKYLDNQAQTVSSFVKKFYSEVMQDILPPSSIDPVEVAAADLPLNPYLHADFNKKPKKTITEDTEGCKPREAEDGNSCGCRACSIGCCASHMEGCSMSYKRPPFISRIGVRDQRSDISGLVRKVESEMPSAETGEPNDRSRVMEQDVSLCRTSLKPRELDISSSSESVYGEQADSISTAISHKLSPKYIDSSTKEATSNNKKEFISFEGRSYISGTDADANHIDPELELVGKLAESKFEETCVLVEGHELPVAALNDSKHKSYKRASLSSLKKKIREALSAKLRPSRKKEYEKLSAQYSIQVPDAERLGKPTPAFFDDLNPTWPEAQHAPASDWEIV